MIESNPPPRSRRVLVVLSSLCAEGTPVLTLDLCRHWISMGISPTVATLSDHPNDLEEEFRHHRIPIERIELPSSGLRRFAALATATYRLCLRLAPHAILSMPLGWHSFMFMGARAAGVTRTAAHVGNYPPVDGGRALEKFRFLVQIGRPLTDVLICCSSYIEAGVVEHFGLSRDETTVIYNGVDVDAMTRRAGDRSTRGQRSPDQPFVVGMVARLEVHKDHPTLIRAAAALSELGTPIEVWLIGEGSRRVEYQQLIAALGLEQQVKLLGMRRDVPELLGQMDAFVFSAKPDEGLGVALIEAMAARLPIIATDVGACREVLDGGDLGELVPAGDSTAMARAIARLREESAADPGRLDRARARVFDRFSAAEMSAAYARCLELA